MSTERISQHIKTLYSKRHNGTKKNKEKYQNKTYQDALFDQIKDKFEGIMLENMSDILANALFTIIQDAAKDIEPETASKPRDASSIVHSNSLSKEEQESIQTLCTKVSSILLKIKQQANTIERTQKQLEDLLPIIAEKSHQINHSHKKWHRRKGCVRWNKVRTWKMPVPKWVNAQRLKSYLDFQRKETLKDIENSYSNLNKQCLELMTILINKQNIHLSFKQICDIIRKINNGEYKVSDPKDFNTLSHLGMISEFQKRIVFCLEYLKNNN